MILSDIFMPAPHQICSKLRTVKECQSMDWNQKNDVTIRSCAAALRVGMKSGLFVILLTGMTSILFQIFQIHIIHKIDGKKQNSSLG